MTATLSPSPQTSVTSSGHTAENLRPCLSTLASREPRKCLHDEVNGQSRSASCDKQGHPCGP